MIPNFLKTYALWILAAALATTLVLAGAQTVRLAGAKTEFAEYKAAVASLNGHREKQRAEDERISRKTEQLLVDEAEQARKEKNEAIQTGNARVAALNDRLRLERTARPVASSGQAATPVAAGASGTGAGLYLEDGLFLTGLAAEAWQVVVERDMCYRQYEGARKALIDYELSLEGEVK